MLALTHIIRANLRKYKTQEKNRNKDFILINKIR